jgi:uncharacterized protein (DUF433 family)
MRLNHETLSRLDERAGELGLTRSRLAEAYLEEGLRMDRHHGIVFRQRPSGRQPMLAGTRLSVKDVVLTYRDNANSVEETADYLGKPVHFIQAALDYYADYKGEVDSWIEDDERLAEREHAAWLRRQQIRA